MKDRLQYLEDLIRERYEKTIFHALGLQILQLDSDCTRMCVDIDHRHRQPLGLVHGGLYPLLAESAASLAGTLSLLDEQKYAVGIEVNASHLRAHREGTIFALTRALHCGSRTLVYEVSIEDEQKKLLSICRCTLLVVERSLLDVDMFKTHP